MRLSKPQSKGVEGRLCWLCPAPPVPCTEDTAVLAQSLIPFVTPNKKQELSITSSSEGGIEGVELEEDWG